MCKSITIGMRGVGGEKMSKSRGNFLTAAGLLTDYDADQIRYYLALLGLSRRQSNFF
jgi:methionyl-tRNA synthetase